MSKPRGAMGSPYGDGANDEMREHYEKMASAMARDSQPPILAAGIATPELPGVVITKTEVSPESKASIESRTSINALKSRIIRLISAHPDVNAEIESVSDTEITFSMKPNPWYGENEKALFKITKI